MGVRERRRRARSRAPTWESRVETSRSEETTRTVAMKRGESESGHQRGEASVTQSSVPTRECETNRSEGATRTAPMKRGESESGHQRGAASVTQSSVCTLECRVEMTSAEIGP